MNKSTNVRTSLGLALTACLTGLWGCEPVAVGDDAQDPTSQADANVAHSRGTISRRAIGPTTERFLPLQKAANVNASLGCADWRWIGVRNPKLDKCPVPTLQFGWKVSQLFSGQATLPTELEPFCIYEYQAAGSPNPTAVTGLVKSGDLTRTDRDCLAVSPLASKPLEEAVSPALREWFGQQTGKPTVVSANVYPTRLAIVDDLPTRAPDQKPATIPAKARVGEHGYAMANLASDTVCTGAFCAAEISSRLAIKHTKFSKKSYPGPAAVDETKGGVAGMLSDLAQAIYAELDAFQTSSHNNGHLVINLSLGWRDKFGGHQPVSAMPAPALAVYRALELASCQNVITVAAAGNRVFGPSADPGPWYPAAWESRPAPTSSVCRYRYGVIAGMPASSHDLIRPMLYSAGGLNSLGHLLSMGAEKGTPRLVAYADHATTKGRADGAFTTPMTGTSISAIVTSSTAALVWYYKPELRSDQVMDLLYVSDAELAANPVGLKWSQLPIAMTADYGLSSGDSVRRVDACQALTLACPVKAGLCPPPTAFKCHPWIQQLPRLPLLESEDFQATLDPTALSTTSMDPDDSPQSEFSDMLDAPWLRTQPSDHFCPGCVISFSAAKAYFSIVNPYSSTMLNPTLHVAGTAYGLGSLTVKPGSTKTVANPLYASGVTLSPIAPVFLSFELQATGLSVTNAILVVM